MSKSKCIQEAAAKRIAASTDKDGLYRLMKAIEMSNRLMAEDILRESGYMLPQSANSQNLLVDMINDGPKTFPKDVAKEILETIPCNEPDKLKKIEPSSYKCGYCGVIFQQESGELVCPQCKTRGDGFTKL